MRIDKIIDKLTLPIFDVIFLPNHQILLHNCPVILGNHLPLGFTFSSPKCHKKINYTDRLTGMYKISFYYYHRGSILWLSNNVMESHTVWIAGYRREDQDTSDFYIQLKDINRVNEERKMSYCLV